MTIFEQKVIEVWANRIDQRHRCDDVERWIEDLIGWYVKKPLVLESAARAHYRGHSPVNGKVNKRFSRWPKDQLRYEFSEEDFTLYPQV